MKPMELVLLSGLILASGYADIITPSSRVPDSDVTWPNAVWQDAGRTGGIPARDQVVFASVKDAPYNATGDGVTNDYTAIQTCINDCPAGQVVLFPAGTYFLSTSQLKVKKSIVLRGVNPATAIIKGGISTYGGFLQVGYDGGSNIAGAYSDAWMNGNATDITAGCTRGSTTITVSSTSPGGAAFVVGNYMCIAGENPDVVNTNNDENDGDSWSPAAGYLTKITAINGNDITVADPIPWTWTVNRAYLNGNLDNSGLPKAVCYNRSNNAVNFLENAGIEDLGFDGNAKICSVGFRYAANCWMHNCIVRNTHEMQVGVRIAAKITIHGNLIHDSEGTGSGGGYGILVDVKSTKVLVENNRFNLNSGSIKIDDGAYGSVVAYNYLGEDDTYFQAEWQQLAIGHHRSHPFMTLMEGNFTHNVIGDNVHGSCSHTTLFRNRVHGQLTGKTNFLGTIWMDRNSSYFNSVGNILGTSGTHDTYQQAYNVDGAPAEIAYTTKAIYTLGFVNYHNNDWPNPPLNEPHDINARDTAYRHGDWDIVTNGITWDGGNADHSIPASLYLSGKPSWWGNIPWPPYDPAAPTDDEYTRIPAGYYYLNGSYPPSTGTLTTGTLTIGP